MASDGCNHLEGDYSVDGEEFSSPLQGNIGGVGCAHGVDYDELLAAADRVETSGDELVFHDGPSMILRLERRE